MEEKKLDSINNSSPEKEVVISVKGLTKDYGKGRGIFDISFDVYKGTVFGYCGTNGSGKTTTLRHIMGFINISVHIEQDTENSKFLKISSLIKVLSFIYSLRFDIFLKI